MSFNLVLKPSCRGCGSSIDLYGSICTHMTLCLSCGKTMAENHGKCDDCGVTITQFIREYNVRSSSTSDRTYFIGKFVTGVPNFSKKKNAVNKWSLQKEGLQGCQVTNALRDEEDEDEAIEEEGGLRKSVKDLQKLFGRATGLLDDSDGKDDDYMDVEMGLSPVVARKQEDAPKEEPADISPSEAGPSGSVRGIPSSSKSSKIKRKSGGDDAEVVTGPPAVKVRFDNESKPSAKDERLSTPKSSASPKISASSAKAGPTLATGPVTEE
ncbi:transcription initiation factor IIF subunit alpha-like isoform X2 [Macadamia integrifolia]|uniref:transcription initiation factor IIF subunit alpha-like isoform X2 n=1 Tax=Macadamia integrifolia TaxID=60698 RepID=UPI001C53105C|nr:transcription initiation factor IIF subunit alpha-like isoform X2 [Macadamia integrifolia]